MHDPRLIPLKTMTSDILKVSREGMEKALGGRAQSYFQARICRLGVGGELVLQLSPL